MVGHLKNWRLFDDTRVEEWTVSGEQWTVNSSWRLTIGQVYRLLAIVFFSLLACFSDAARLLHVSDPAVRAWASVVVD